ncbi:response regulator transcription factor [Robiginitalea sp. SC105]|uniref:response regulator transcription factor n=1 Tax=Robiginitalea sp. SC105 TaxID=2762332 RepID=UPI001639ACF8|nr:response regulator transcription factor [Robiginitalea sp. SC105]MBC2840112.1 response regulator transcription factor [Robiginitalea sp. SC105]
MKSKLKVVIVDDENRAINRLKILIRYIDDLECIGGFQRPEEALSFISKTNPELAFVDVEMPHMDGIHLAQKINSLGVKTKVVFVTAHKDYAIEAINISAFGYLVKPVGLDKLKNTVLRYLDEKKLAFTERELEIIELLQKGDSSALIAQKLHLSKHTIDTHRRRMLSKAGCKNTAELIAYALSGASN